MFKYLAINSITVDANGEVFSTHGNRVLSNTSGDLSGISPCTQEEADTRVFLHAKDASNAGKKKVMIRTVDTDVVVIGIGIFQRLSVTELWVSFGTRKHHRYIPIHSLAGNVGNLKSSCLPLFHTLTGFDQVSFLPEEVKRLPGVSGSSMS